MALSRCKKGSPLLLGHRGASADAPENTMAAFTLAIEQRADGVELDVWRCGTGEVVVHHDADTRRTAGAPLRVATASLSELRALDVGAWKARRFGGERIPLLSEVLASLPDAIVNIELKSKGIPDLALPGAVARAVRGARAQRRCIVSSFDYLLLAVFRVVAPEIPCGVLFGEGRSWQAREALGTALLRPHAVHPQASLVTEARAHVWGKRGLAVNPWTVDEPEEIARLARLGACAIITNRPGLARRALQDS